MKSKLIGSIFFVISVPALAQSSVTLYGVIDEGINYANNVRGNRMVELQSGYAQGSRWGLKGAEDLGGGTKVLFQLENGFNASNGRLAQGGLFFGRQAYVGLQNGDLGTLTLGRQYDAIVDYVSQTTANGNWAGYLFSHVYDNDNTDYSYRVNNSVKYTSPTFGGFQFGGVYGFSNSTNFANNRHYSFGGQYTNGGLLIAAAYALTNNPSSTAGGALNNAGDANFLGTRLRIYGVGTNYTFGATTLGFAYTGTEITQPLSTEYVGAITPSTGTASSLRFHNFELNAKYQLTPAFYVGGMYVYTRANFNVTSGSQHPTYQTVGLMADYNLSKRTDIYVQGAYQRVGGDSTGTVLDVAYIPGANDVSSNRNQVVLRAAIRHKF
ncbi:porin [Pandoraea terrae]|uniref:Porin n=1 Tax=Pandoraea terrae TaxID=1537710 RepID=A0A5E4UYD1_9BURK|nr:porin [Pandoraea terrae]VVE05032.1 porin [Pandoraea terrae]